MSAQIPANYSVQRRYPVELVNELLELFCRASSPPLQCCSLQTRPRSLPSGALGSIRVCIGGEDDCVLRRGKEGWEVCIRTFSCDYYIKIAKKMIL